MSQGPSVPRSAPCMLTARALRELDRSDPDMVRECCLTAVLGRKLMRRQSMELFRLAEQTIEAEATHYCHVAMGERASIQINVAAESGSPTDLDYRQALPHDVAGYIANRIPSIHQTSSPLVTPTQRFAMRSPLDDPLPLYGKNAMSAGQQIQLGSPATCRSRHGKAVELVDRFRRDTAQDHQSWPDSRVDTASAATALCQEDGANDVCRRRETV
jgi:hypothetical protein